MTRLQGELARQNAVIAQRSQTPVAGPKLRSRALVIGNSAYTGPGALPNPRRDAQAIASKLRALGLEVDLVLGH